MKRLAGFGLVNMLEIRSTAFITLCYAFHSSRVDLTPNEKVVINLSSNVSGNVNISLKIA